MHLYRRGPVRPSRPPPSMLSSPPSARITANRLTAITPSAPPHCGPVPGIASSRRTGRGDDGRHCLRYHQLRKESIPLNRCWRQGLHADGPPAPAARYRRRSHRGRYHTDRQPGAAAQYTARCPAVKVGTTPPLWMIGEDAYMFMHRKSTRQPQIMDQISRSASNTKNGSITLDQLIAED